MKSKISSIILAILILTILLSIGCTPIDTSKAQVTFKQTIRLPAGFSIESSIPLNISELSRIGEVNPNRFYEKEKFSLPVEIKNDNQIHKNTRIQLEYSQNTIQFLYPYFVNGAPLNKISPGIFEFDADAKPQATTTIYLAGMTTELPKGYPFVGIDFKLNLLDENSLVLASDDYRIQVYKVNYSIVSNISN